jgi:hypothetical protein
MSDSFADRVRKKPKAEKPKWMTEKIPRASRRPKQQRERFPEPVHVRPDTVATLKRLVCDLSIPREVREKHAKKLAKLLR